MSPGDPDNALTLNVDHDGAIRDANESAERTFLDGDRLAGRSLNELIESRNGVTKWRGVEGPFTADVLAHVTRAGSVELRFVPASPERESSIRMRDDLLQVTTRLARAGAWEIDEAVVEILGRIGRMSGVDRAYLFFWTEDGEHAKNTHEWTRAGAVPQIVDLQRFPREHFTWFEEVLVRDSHLLIRSLDEVPDHATVARAVLEEGDMRSLLCT
ncbi:MAG: hypothetical protein R3338_07660 [Thermoanaerobaculia bacterium]|nr:hypothetical protein [Thermoanaerobaculia bacterium]